MNARIRGHLVVVRGQVKQLLDHLEGVSGQALKAGETDVALALAALAADLDRHHGNLDPENVKAPEAAQPAADLLARAAVATAAPAVPPSSDPAPAVTP